MNSTLNEKKQIPKYMRDKQLAEYFSVGRSTIWYWHKLGRFGSKKLSSRVTVFEVAEVEKALFGEYNG